MSTTITKRGYVERTNPKTHEQTTNTSAFIAMRPELQNLMTVYGPGKYTIVYAWDENDHRGTNYTITITKE